MMPGFMAEALLGVGDGLSGRGSHDGHEGFTMGTAASGVTGGTPAIRSSDS